MFSRFKKKKYLYSPQVGEIVELEKVPDEVFAQKLFGEGFAVIPEGGEIYSPIAGVIKMVSAPSLHAYGIETDDGLELLIHVGIDTVEMKGEGFKTFVQAGDKVLPGDLLGEVDLIKVRQKGYNTHMIVAVGNSDKLKSFEVKCNHINDLDMGVFEYATK